MIIRGGIVLNGENGQFENTPLHIKDDTIAAFADVADTDVLDAEGLYVLPGMIDTHIHGYVGVEFACESGGFDKAQTALAADGVTGFAATVRCMPLEEMLVCAANAAAQMRAPTAGSRVLGIHYEGPFVSFERTGAMIPPKVTCTVDAVNAMIDAAGGELKLMTIAPERENALDAIAAATARGVACTMGHTNATYAQTLAGVDAGARRATHVFNAMRPLSHRETGVLGAVLTDDRVRCEMIADFVHLDPAAVKLVYRAKGAQNITLISDDGAQSGLPDGDYVVGGRVRHVRDGLCLTDDGVICGSCFSMLKGAQNLRSLGIPLEEIAVMASLNPAVDLGVEDRFGSIARGKVADLIVVDDAFRIHAVVIGGKRIV